MSYAETISLDRRSREAKDRFFSSTGIFCFSAFLAFEPFQSKPERRRQSQVQGYCKQPPSSKPSWHFHFPTTALDHPSVLFTGGLVSFRRHSLSLSSTRSRRHPRPPVVEHKFYSCPNNFYHPGLSQDRGLAIRVESRYQSARACTLGIFSIVCISY